MNDTARPERRKLKKLPVFLVILAGLLALLVVPPLIGIGRYKNRIAGLLSASLGRPVRISSVELRLLPWPGFAMTDLSVAEDPAYGWEPVLHADTVRADIRLLPLWRGRIEIGSIHVDDASLNLVRAGRGKWNLDSLFRTAAAKAGAGKAGGNGSRTPLPYLEATDSRINIKNGAEKLPFSLVNTDLSFWQEDSGQWRIRLRGQPARTDVVVDMGDTGTVRLEASVRSAPALHLMPLHADLDWREAQLGQLSRLVLGSDRGWRGDLTGEAHLDGTPEAMRVTARLRASGVHRAEFAPPSPLDFDANCGFVYHYAQRAVDDLSCSSPLGAGRLRLMGELPGSGAPDLALELDQVPAAAALAALRTVRGSLAADLEATGTMNGRLSYAAQANNARNPRPKAGTHFAANQPVSGAGRLTGSVAIDGFSLSGGGLSQPLRAARFVLEPAELDPAPAGHAQNAQGPNTVGAPAQILAGTAAIPAGGAAPLAITAHLALFGYQAIVHGQASIERAREIARLAGHDVLDGLAGEPISINLIAEGPWLPAEPALEPPTAAQAPSPAMARGKAATADAESGRTPADFDRGMRPAADTLTGTVTVRNANWRADYLAGHVQIAQATLRLGGAAAAWDPVVFTYGPVQGTASLTLPTECTALEPLAPQAAPQAALQGAPACEPAFEAQFSVLDLGALQSALLGVRRPGTMLSELIDRLSRSSAPPWPAMHGTIKADSATLGPLTLTHGSADLEIAGNSAKLTGIDAALLGGRFHGSCTVHWAGGERKQPAYAVEGRMERLSAAAAGRLLSMRWTGGTIGLDGTVDAAGFTPADLAATATGKLHFDWRHGSVASAGATASGGIPPALARFEEWSGEAKIGGGAIAIGENQAVAGRRSSAVHATLLLTAPPKAQFGEAARAR